MDMLTDMLGQKKITLVSGNAVDEKKSSPEWMQTSFFKSIFLRFLFSSLVCFACFAFLILVFFCLFVWCFLKLKMYILIHIWICGRVSDKKISTWPISGNKTSFFGLNTLFLIDAINIYEWRCLEFDSYISRKWNAKNAIIA